MIIKYTKVIKHESLVHLDKRYKRGEEGKLQNKSPINKTRRKTTLWCNTDRQEGKAQISSWGSVWIRRRKAQVQRRKCDTHLFPQGFRHLVDEAAHLSELAWVFDVRPGAQRHQRYAHHHVTHRRHRVYAHKACHHRHHVHDEHHGEERGGRARREENVLSVVVFDKVCVGLVELLLQLLLIAAAELLSAHLLHRAELTHAGQLQLVVAALQIGRRDVGFVSSTHLHVGNEQASRAWRAAGWDHVIVCLCVTYLLHALVVRVFRSCYGCQVIGFSSRLHHMIKTRSFTSESHNTC